MYQMILLICQYWVMYQNEDWVSSTCGPTHLASDVISLVTLVVYTLVSNVLGLISSQDSQSSCSSAWKVAARGAVWCLHLCDCGLCVRVYSWLPKGYVEQMIRALTVVVQHLLGRQYRDRAFKNVLLFQYEHSIKFVSMHVPNSMHD